MLADVGAALLLSVVMLVVFVGPIILWVKFAAPKDDAPESPNSSSVDTTPR